MTAGEPEASLSAGVAILRSLREAPALMRGIRLTLVLMTLGTGMQIVVPIVIQQIVDGMIDEMLAAGDVDLIASFGYPLPATVISESPDAESTQAIGAVLLADSSPSRAS